MARYDFDLSGQEAGLLTPHQFDLLWRRYYAGFKRDCYLQGIVASAVYNSQRKDWKQDVLSPFDFVPRPPEDTQHDSIVIALREELTLLAQACPEQVPNARQKWFETLTAKSIPNVEKILLEVFQGFGA